MMFNIYFKSDLEKDANCKYFDRKNIKTMEELEKIFNYYDGNDMIIHFKNIDNQHNTLIIEDIYGE